MSSLRQGIDAVAFDLDGTLADTLPDLRGALNRMLAEIGRRPVRIDEIMAWVGDGVSTLVARALDATGGPHSEPMVERYFAQYRGHTVERTKLFPNVRETLETLKQDGVALGVCTNKSIALATEVLEGLDIARYFSVVLGGDSVPRHKPHPDHLLMTLEALGARPERAAMVGDSINDILTARAAGVKSVAVSFGYANRPVADLGADMIIDDFAVLPSVLAVA